MLLNVGQTGRRGRGWWRTILDQYGASDVVMPEARIYRQYPGGPVIGVFTAFHGPDRRELARFSLSVPNADALPALLDAGVARLDEAYQNASRGGAMAPDALLSPPPAPEVTPTPTPTPTDGEQALEQLAGVGSSVVQIQFDTPTAGAVASGEASVRAVPGVSSAVTGSLALGGTSVMRVAYSGDISGLRAALEARGWTVQESGGTLSIRRAAPPPAPLAPPTPSPTPPPGD